MHLINSDTTWAWWERLHFVTRSIKYGVEGPVRLGDWVAYRHLHNQMFYSSFLLAHLQQQGSTIPVCHLGFCCPHDQLGNRRGEFQSINQHFWHAAHGPFATEVVATVFQCSPIDRNYSEGRCLNNTYWFFMGSSIPHIITDIALIGLPMPLIWKLQMRRSQKATLSFIFGMGGL